MSWWEVALIAVGSAAVASFVTYCVVLLWIGGRMWNP